MKQPEDLLPEAEVHFWYPVPKEERRHAFTGARRWEGQTAETTVCGREVAMARASEMDWIHLPTCEYCWETLIDEQRKRSG